MYFFLFLMQLISIKFINKVNEIELNWRKKNNYEFRLYNINKT